MSSKGMNILITGCNRGIGLELVKQILVTFRPQNLIATCRDPSAAKELHALQEKHKNLHILKLEIRETDKFGDFVTEVAKLTGDDGLNLLINNAGIFSQPSFNSIFDLDKADLILHFENNTLAPLFLAKAFLPLLEKASGKVPSAPMGIGKAAIVNISTRLASIEDCARGPKPGGSYSYRTSKSALNMATKCMSVELKGKGILTVPLHPGWVQTDLGGKMAPLTVEDSVSGMVKVMGKLGERDNGRFLQYDGEELQW